MFKKYSVIFLILCNVLSLTPLFSYSGTDLALPIFPYKVGAVDTTDSVCPELIDYMNDQVIQIFNYYHLEIIVAIFTNSKNHSDEIVRQLSTANNLTNGIAIAVF